MNGIRLLVLIAAIGQMGVAAGQQGGTPAIGPNRDYGWKFDDQRNDGALCYIVQVSPEDALIMQRDFQEYPSDMPPDLVGRVTRILFRIGTEVLPQTPSLEEIRKVPRVASPGDVNAILGPGRSSNVEGDAVVNVQQDRSLAPSLPFNSPAFSASPSPANNPLAPRTSLAERAAQASENPIDQAKILARGVPGLSGAGAPLPNNANLGSNAGPPALPSYLDGGNSRFNQQANTNGNAGIAGNWQSQTSPSNQDRTRDDPTRLADNRVPNGYDPSVSAPGGYNQGNYDQRDPASLSQPLVNGIPRVQTPATGFGSFPGYQNQNQDQNKFTGLGNNSNYPPNNGNSQFNNGLNPSNNGLGGGMGAGGPAYNNNPNYQQDNPNHVASNPAVGGNPSVQSQLTPPAGFTTVVSGQNNASSTTPSNATTEPPLKKSRAGENILVFFCLLSLLVNFYLGTLIRKLLTRYRALLANVRGQAGASGYSTSTAYSA